jgi:Methyltransferase FkbM domain
MMTGNSARCYASHVVLRSISVGLRARSSLGRLYDVWPDAHYILVEPDLRFESAVRGVASRLRSAEVHIAGAGGQCGALPNGVPLVTIDSLFAHRPEARCVLKIDVDGPELEVLAGCARLLAGDTVVIIEGALLDWTNARWGQVVEALREAGYECFDIIEPMFRAADDILWQVDLVFVRRDSAVRDDRSFRGGLPRKNYS